jgi:hypothetical protein
MESERTWDLIIDTTLYAKWTINSYECEAGTYLAADGTSCVTCLAGSYCVGGTYDFNTTTAQ